MDYLEKLNADLLKAGWISEYGTRDLAGGNGQLAVRWTPMGLAAIIMLAKLRRERGLDENTLGMFMAVGEQQLLALEKNQPPKSSGESPRF